MAVDTLYMVARAELATRAQVVSRDRFEVIHRIGEGAGGEVLKVRDRFRAGRILALKLAGIDESFGLGTLDRFYREHETLNSIAHPHIIRPLEMVQVSGRLGYLMEYVDALDLATQVQERLFSWDEIDRIIDPLLDAVACLHRHGVLHRDLKLENVLYSEQVGVKLADFGLVKDCNTNSITASGILLGTAQYFAPEYIRRGTYDERSEVYALGLLLYELCVGDRVLPNLDGKQALDQLISNRCTLSLDLPAEIPFKYRHIIEGATDPNPLRRFQTVEEMRDALALPRWRYEAVDASDGAGNAPLVPLVEGQNGASFGDNLQTFLSDFARLLVTHPACLAAEVVLAAVVTGGWVLG